MALQFHAVSDHETDEYFLCFFPSFAHNSERKQLLLVTNDLVTQIDRFC